VSERKRVLVIANKWWECEPLMFVLLHDNARPSQALGWPDPLNYPRPRPDQNPLPAENPNPVPCAVFHLARVDVEIWCISDLMEHLPDRPQFQSSSEVKMRYMHRIFEAGSAPSLVIGFGTAGLPDTNSENGSVAVGTGVFMHNAHPNGENPDSNWSGGPFDTLLTSSLDPSLFDAITTIETSPRPSVMGRFVVPPLNPAAYGKLLARCDMVALGTVNVTDYREYGPTGRAALDAFTQQYNISLARSLETTHGLIRVSSDAPFLFVSALPNRADHFADEVDPRPYAQNTAAAHNGGIVVAWMLPLIDRAL
jgi:hypothetical protein